jgi:outer membrane lipoprotein-sorting protein
MKNLVLVVLLLLSGQTDTDELQKLFHNFNVQSIDASIVQVIAETGKETQRYEGRYRAYNDCMRIDYSKPFQQIVIVNGGKLLWYYPDTKELWTMSQGNVPAVHPYAQRDILNERIVVKSKKKVWYGFFNSGYRYTLFDSKTGVTLELTIDKDKGYPVKKITYTAQSIEVMRELYSDYTLIHGIWFPATVEVIARTHTGTTRNVTRYYNVILNGNVSTDIFTLQLPKGVRAKTM